MAKRHEHETRVDPVDEMPLITAKFFDGEEFTWDYLPYATRRRWAQEIANRGASVASIGAIQKARDCLYAEAGSVGKKTEVASDERVRSLFSDKAAPRRDEFEAWQLECQLAWKASALNGTLGEIGVEVSETQVQRDRIAAMEKTVNDVVTALNAAKTAANAALPAGVPKQKMSWFYKPLATGKGAKEQNDAIKEWNLNKTLAKLVEYDGGQFKQAELFERHLRQIQAERARAKMVAKAKTQVESEEVDDLDSEAELDQAAQ